MNTEELFQKLAEISEQRGARRFLYTVRTNSEMLQLRELYLQGKILHSPAGPILSPEDIEIQILDNG